MISTTRTSESSNHGRGSLFLPSLSHRASRSTGGTESLLSGTFMLRVPFRLKNGPPETTRANAFCKEAWHFFAEDQLVSRRTPPQHRRQLAAETNTYFRVSDELERD